MYAEHTGLIIKALNFAAQKHRNQRRKDQAASPYINHPIDVANILWNEAGVTNELVITAAILHDTVEDTQTTFEELEYYFGEKIRDIVAEVTDDKLLPKDKRKQLQIDHSSQLSQNAKLVKLADKISNLRDVMASPPANWSCDRKREYIEWAKRVIDQIRGTHSILETLFDQVYQQGTTNFPDHPV